MDDITYENEFKVKNENFEVICGKYFQNFEVICGNYENKKNTKNKNFKF